MLGMFFKKQLLNRAIGPYFNRKVDLKKGIGMFVISKDATSQNEKIKRGRYYSCSCSQGKDWSFREIKEKKLKVTHPHRIKRKKLSKYDRVQEQMYNF